LGEELVHDAVVALALAGVEVHRPRDDLPHLRKRRGGGGRCSCPRRRTAVGGPQTSEPMVVKGRAEKNTVPSEIAVCSEINKLTAEQIDTLN